MNNPLRRLVQSSLIIAINLVALAALLPLAWQPAAEFLGKDVAALAVGILAMYPEAAIFELGRIIGLSVGCIFLIVMNYRLLARRMKYQSWWWTTWVSLMTPCVAYICWLAASVLRYPALYENSLPISWQRGVYQLGFMISPSTLQVVALVILTLPFLVWMVERGKRQILLALLALTFTIAGRVLYQNWSNLWPQDSNKNSALAEHPDVIFIGIDSLRYDRLTALHVTPNLNQLLTDPQSVAFDDHIVGVPRTFPSWIEIIQGKNAPQTGIRHMFPGFKQRVREFKGMVTAFREAGYQTHVISDFAGDIFPRFRAGFATVEAPNLTLAAIIRMNVDQMLPLFLPMLTCDWFADFFQNLKESPAFADPRQLTDKALRALAGYQGRRPLFLTVFYSTAHFPYAAPHPYYTRFTSPVYPGPYFFQKNPELKQGARAMTAADTRQMQALYDGAISAIDFEINRIVQALKLRGKWKDTIIVVTADHGEDLNEPGFAQGHGEHLRGAQVLHVPWILKLARQEPVRKRYKGLSRSIDIAATVLAAATIPENLTESVDLLPWVTGERQGEPTLEAYSETGIWFSRTGNTFYQKQRLDYPGISGLLSFDQRFGGEVVLNPAFEKVLVGSRHRALIAGDYKLIYIPTPAGVIYELYNRRIDPDNRYDLSKAEPDLAKLLKEKLRLRIKDLEQDASYYDDFVVAE